MQKKKIREKKLTINELFISVTIVLNNDKKVIRSYLQEVHQVLQKHYRFYEIVAINNGSTDSSLTIITELQKSIPNVRLLSLAKQYESEIAFSAGLENSIGDYVVVQDLNCDPPQEIPKMIDAAKQGFDIVTAVRKSRIESSFIEKIGSKLFYWISINILHIHFPQNDSNFRVFSRRAVTAFSKIKTRYKYLRYFSATSGFSQKVVMYRRKYKQPYKARSFIQLVNLAVNVIVSNSILPLRIVSLLCMSTGIILLFLNLYFISIFIYKNELAYVQIIFYSTVHSILMVAISIIAEYLGRILYENKIEPLYFVSEEQNSSVISGSNQMNVV